MSSFTDAIAKVKLKAALLPCPCCGSTKLYCGPGSHDSMEIKCIDLTQEVGEYDEFPGCRLKMQKYVPDKTPKGIKGKGDKFITNLYQWLLDQAVEAWNRRTNLDPKWGPLLNRLAEYGGKQTSTAGEFSFPAVTAADKRRAKRGNAVDSATSFKFLALALGLQAEYGRFYADATTVQVSDKNLQ